MAQKRLPLGICSASQVPWHTAAQAVGSVQASPPPRVLWILPHHPGSLLRSHSTLDKQTRDKLTIAFVF